MTLPKELWKLIAQARWFAGRSRIGKLGSVFSLNVVADVQSLLCQVHFADSLTETYHVPILHSALPKLRESCDDPLSLWAPFCTGHPDFQLSAQLDHPQSARRFPGEQSNTNIFFDNGAMLKVLRRVEQGESIEAEVLAALDGSGVSPELYGTWSHKDTALGILVELLKDPQDGYDLACSSAQKSSSFAQQAEALGAALATLHSTLRRKLATSQADTTVLAEDCMQRFDQASSEVHALTDFRTAAKEIFDDLGHSLVTTQRIHGDCHLGQVLLSQGRWKYVDFEGEPLQSLADRRKLASPLRDVASMLRSFSYAQHTGGANEYWLTECRRSFLAGYGLETSSILIAYELDKAVYEAVYEQRLRPHLLEVPMKAIRRLLC